MRNPKLLAVVLLLSALAVPQPARAGVVPGVVVAGPPASIVSLGGIAMANDSTGALAYLQNAGGANHLYVSLLSGGSWSSPFQADPGIPTSATQPVIAVANGGRVAVAWMSAGTLYGAVHAAGASAFSAPQAISAALGNPSLSMGVSGTAYLSYTVANGSGTDVDVARLDRTQTAFVPLPSAIDSGPASMAGSGALRSRVSVAADAIGVVAWGERDTSGRTHVLIRRVYGLNESVQTLDLTVGSFAGTAGGSADTPVLGTWDDSSYAWIAFRETFANGGGTVSRVMANELVGSALGMPTEVDSLGVPAGDGADAPAIAVDGGGDALIASELQGSHAVIGAGTMNGALLTGTQISEVADSQPPAPVVALGRSDTGIVAWEPDTGSVQGRLYTGATPQGEVQLSNAALGPVQPGGGLAAASDAGGDQLVAFTQGTPGALQIAVAANVPAPSAPGPLTSAAYMPNALPVLSWTAAPQHWGAVSYAVLIDGNQVGKTTATTFTPAAPLTNGAHTWQVISIDSVGQETPGPIRPLRIDTLLPTVALAIAGAHRVHSKLTFKVTLHPAKGSHVLISYGDGASSKSVRSHHAYRRAGTYTVKVTVTDHARHSEVLTSRLHIS